MLPALELSLQNSPDGPRSWSSRESLSNGCVPAGMPRALSPSVYGALAKPYSSTESHAKPGSQAIAFA